jgi:hypothetical protein
LSTKRGGRSRPSRLKSSGGSQPLGIHLEVDVPRVPALDVQDREASRSERPTRRRRLVFGVVFLPPQRPTFGTRYETRGRIENGPWRRLLSSVR